MDFSLKNEKDFIFHLKLLLEIFQGWKTFNTEYLDDRQLTKAFVLNRA